MKNLNNTLLLSAIVFPILGIVALTSNWQVVKAQTNPLTYSAITTAVRTKLPNKSFKNKTELINWLIAQVKERKVDKALTPDREDILREAGATDELVEVIRQNSPPLSTQTRIIKPTPTPTIKPTGTTPNSKIISSGVVNGKAVNLVRPPYPPAAKAVGASGQVNVQVTIDEEGNVIAASAVSGHPLLRAASETAARSSKFVPTLLSGQKVKVTGVIVYNFAAGNNPSNVNSVKNSLGMEFIKVTAGSFMMGSPTSEPFRKDSESQKQVTIVKSFNIGKYEVTQEQWENVMGINPSSFKGCPKCPVENISWEDVQGFVTKLNQRGEGLYRLPTESEWEYAARAGTTTRYSFSESEGLLDAYAWYADNSGNKTHEVGTKQPNAWGLYDMHGNVWEWCADSSGDFRIIRGGSWFVNASYLRSANRGSYSHLNHDYDLGFRLVVE